MRVLRKTGVRAPFLPGPILTPNVDPLRRTVVIGAIVPMLLLGGVTQPVGGPRPLAPNTDPLRAVAVRGPPVPPPGASVWAPTPAREPNDDPLRPVVVAPGQMPIPGAAVWKGEPARVPNGDPLRPPIIGADAPDSTLAQPNTTWIGRLPRDEDLTRPARPMLVWAPVVPIPGAALWAPTPAHETPGTQPDRVGQELALILTGWQPVSGAIAQFIGRPVPPEDTNWPARPLPVVGIPPPLPGAVMRATYAPRDEVAPPATDRLAPTWISTPPVQPSSGVALFLGSPRLEVPEHGVAPVVRIGAQPLPGATFALLSRPALEPLERGAPALVRVGMQPLPDAGAQWLHAARDEVAAPGTRLAPTWIGVGPTPLPGARALLPAPPRASDDRVPLNMLVRSGAQPTPDARSVVLAAPRDGAGGRPLPALVQVGPQVQPDARALFSRAVLATPTARVPGPALLTTPAVPWPAARAWFAAHPFDSTAIVFPDICSPTAADVTETGVRQATALESGARQATVLSNGATQVAIGDSGIRTAEVVC